MNGLIILADRYIWNNGNGNIATSYITTDYIELNLGGVRSLSVIDDLNNKAFCIDVLSLPGVIYNNNSFYLIKIQITVTVTSM